MDADLGCSCSARGEAGRTRSPTRGSIYVSAPPRSGWVGKGFAGLEVGQRGEGGGPLVSACGVKRRARATSPSPTNLNFWFVSSPHQISVHLFWLFPSLRAKEFLPGLGHESPCWFIVRAACSACRPVDGERSWSDGWSELDPMYDLDQNSVYVSHQSYACRLNWQDGCMIFVLAEKDFLWTVWQGLPTLIKH